MNEDQKKELGAATRGFTVASEQLSEFVATCEDLTPEQNLPRFRALVDQLAKARTEYGDVVENAGFPRPV